jgi:Transcription elongation factor, GreA/GreB, C-term.
VQPASKTANVWRAALPKAAYNRLRQEQELLRAELAEEPPLTAAVDRAAAQAQRRDHEVRRQRLVQRLTELDKLFDRAAISKHVRPAQRPYPGCVIVTRDGNTGEREIYTIAEVVGANAGYEAARPDSPMGRALAGAMAGRTVSFPVSENRTRVIHVLEIRDDLPEL